MNHRPVQIGTAALALIALSPAALAAQAPEQASEGNARGLPNPPVPPNETPLDRFGPLASQQIQITGGTEDDSASVALEIGRWRASPAYVNGARALRRTTGTLNLIVSTPLDGEDEAAPATLDGLANGTSVTLRFGQWTGYTVLQNPLEAQDIVRRAREKCHRIEDAAQTARMRALGPNPAQAAVDAINAVHSTVQSDCDDPSDGSQNLVERQLPSELRDYTALIRPADLRQYGAEVSVGRNNFDFVDPANLAESSERHLQWSGKIFYTQYLRGSKTALTLSAGYERAYEAAEEEIFCPPNPNNVVTRCMTARGAPPESNESLLLSAGLRHQFARGGLLRNLAVAPLVTYDAVDDVFGVDVPVYFIPNADGGLTGGVRFGYRSDRDNKFSIGIFIGAAFNILK